MKKKIVFLTVFFLFFVQGSKLNANCQENVQLINYNQSKIIDMITLTPWINYNNTKEFQSKDVFLDFTSAFEKFSQSNISAAYRDFSKIIHNSSKDDFLYFNLAYEFAQMGLFSLAQNSLVQIEDINLWSEQIKSLKQVYFPSVSLSFEEEIYLAEIYSNIMYSNMAMESVEELSRNHKLLKKLDYANYLLALAHYKNKNYSRSLNYINKAIAFDNANVNYLGFKAQILSDDTKYKDSIDIISIIDQKNIVLMNYMPKLELLKDYNLAKSARNKYEGKFLTANYYFKNGDSQRAIKELNSLIAKKKKYSKAYALLGEIYLQQDNRSKAREYFDRAYQLNKKDPYILVSIANLEFTNLNYTLAQNYYLNALKKDKNLYKAYIGLAMINYINKLYDKSYENCLKAAEVSKAPYLTSYIMSKLEKDKKTYLRRTLSLNPLYVNAWLDLSKIAFDEKDYTTAEKYLYPIKLISPKNDQYIKLKNLIEIEKNTL